MKPQLTGKALVAAGHLLAKQIGPNTPLKDISALISSLATHLDVALARGDLLQKQVDIIANAEYEQRLANAEHQLYMAELRSSNLRTSRMAQFRKRKAVEAERDTLLHKISLQTEQLPDAFYSIGEQLRNQDNRCTDQPMFVVFEKREIIGSDEHSPSRIVWVWEGEEVDELRSKRLELLHQDGRDTRGCDRYAMQEIDVFVTACFTEQGCKDYLRINGHNLRQPFIFAVGSYRNHEYQTIRDWLTGLNAQDEELQKGVA